MGTLRRAKFFVDECLSPQIARRLNATGQHEAVHPLDGGRRGEPDATVVARCLAEDRIIVTENARDFRKLVAREAIHPGLILMPSVDRETSGLLLCTAIAHLARLAPERPQDAIVNCVLEVEETGICRVSPLP